MKIIIKELSLKAIILGASGPFGPAIGKLSETTESRHGC